MLDGTGEADADTDQAASGATVASSSRPSTMTVSRTRSGPSAMSSPRSARPGFGRQVSEGDSGVRGTEVDSEDDAGERIERDA